MLKTTIQLTVLLLMISTLTGLAANEHSPATAVINSIYMMEGDEPGWGDLEFDSSLWPVSAPVQQSGFIRILLPDSVAWLRTQPFPLPKAFSEQPSALYVVSGASFQVYWNGVLIGENGQPADNISSEIDGLADSRFYIPAHLMHETNNVLAIRYSAHGYARLHLPLSISLRVSRYQDEKYDRLVSHVPALLLLGAVGVASLFYGALYFRRRTDKGSLWLALMFLMVTFQSAAEISRALISFAYPGIIARMILVLLFAYGSGLFLNLFLLSFFRLPDFKRAMLWLTHIAVLIVALFHYHHFDKLTFAVTAIFVLCALGLAGYGVLKKRPGALPLLVTLSVFCLSFLVGYTRFLDSYYYAAMALLAVTLFVLQANAVNRTERLSAEEKLKSSRLELELIKRQIQPHFIMNTLTALSEWILTNPESSVDMINALADEFRILNEYSDKKLVPLESELELCRSHLKIMSYRQDQKFILNTDLPDPGLCIPPAIIHTLIENALTHNRYSDENTVFNFVQKKNKAGDLEFTLTTPAGKKTRRDGNGNQGSGMGLTYVNTRLQEAWPDAFSVDSGEDEQGGWQTRIMVRAEAVS